MSQRKFFETNYEMAELKERLSRKTSKEEKLLRLLDYLKEYTDENHKASLPMIEEYFTKHYWPGYFGDKNTRKNLIKEMVRVLNSNEKGELLPEQEWRVVYDDFVRDYVTEPEVQHAEHHICNIYYRHPFDKSELLKIMMSISQNESLSSDDKSMLKERLKRELGSREFFDAPKTPSERTKEETRKRRVNGQLIQAAARKQRSFDDEDW